MENQPSIYTDSAVLAYRTALGIMLAGFAFALCSLQVFGMDILLDAVGWLLVFVGLRPLEKPSGGFGPRAILCLGLVAVSAVQLFSLGEGAQLVLLVLRGVLEGILFLSLIVFFGHFLAAFGWQTAAKWFGLAFCVNTGVGFSFAAIAVLFGGQVVMGWWVLVFSALGFAARLLLAGVLVWLMVRLTRKAEAQP